ncbi:alpha/beta-hydrolase family protein [Oerskovia sp. Root22]|uniref:alpha/beta hydrolase n=1 Tax=Oerskovia sp. Root22 TaxID=1736494 RepID=UPI0009E91CF6|nr:alpha/beta-hydrolase family protein [Oerskovia sp. Root22]
MQPDVTQKPENAPDAGAPEVAEAVGQAEPAGPTDEPGARSTTPDGEPGARPSRRRRAWAWLQHYARRFSTTGLVLALLFFCYSLTPSLIPRAWYYQALITGMSMVGGYGIGAFVEWFALKVGLRIRWSPRVSRIAWWVLGAATIVLVPLFLVLGARWQHELRALFGMPEQAPANDVAVVFVAVLIAIGVLQLGRALRRVAQWVSLLVDNIMPKPIARFLSGVIVAVVVVLLFNGVIWAGALHMLNNVYASANEQIDPKLAPPTSPDRSGSPESGSSWESLGAEGRRFVALGPTQAELTEFAAGGDVIDPADVQEPIRVYAGLDPEGDLDATAQRVVDELDRTNAWDRSVLVVATTTGTGWVDPGMSNSLELMHGGDTAIASMQYSYLPSWISFVGDRSTPPNAGKALYEAVYEAWSKQPEDSRPRLMAFGISLGSFGAQGAFSGLQDMTTRTDGAMFVGTPNFTPNWTDFTTHRDAGSLEYSPVYEEGAQVRWGTEVSSAANIWSVPGTWETPRVVYVQHASDGVTWWSPTTLWSEPDWMREPHGPDVLDAVEWRPVVTFWQLTGDLFVAAASDIPAGHGHVYYLEYADGWSALNAPDGWDEDETLRLKEQMLTKQPAASSSTG